MEKNGMLASSLAGSEFSGSEFLCKEKRTVADCIEDAKTAKFCLYFILGLVSGRKVEEMFPFPLGEFHDEEMNDVFEMIVDILGKKGK